MAKSSWSSVWIRYIAVFQLAAAVLFVAGFLLTRYELSHTSEACDPVRLVGPTATPSPGDSGDCAEHRAYDQVILVIIDALRFDFLFYNTTATTTGKAELTPLYQNKFHSVRDALQKHPHHR